MTMGRNIFACRRLNKSVSVFLLVFEAVFLNVIVPGHTRGVITLTGKNSVVSMADLGCPFCSHQSNSDPKKAPDGKDQQECAICHLAVRLTLPPVVDFRLGELTLLEVVPPPAPVQAPVCIIVPVQYCRGPPVISV